MTKNEAQQIQIEAVEEIKNIIQQMRHDGKESFSADEVMQLLHEYAKRHIRP